MPLDSAMIQAIMQKMQAQPVGNPLLPGEHGFSPFLHGEPTPGYHPPREGPPSGLPMGPLLPPQDSPEFQAIIEAVMKAMQK